MESFGLLLKMRCILFTEQPYTDQRFCIWKILFYQQPCAKAQEFCKAEFLDSLPVSALETGVLISEFSSAEFGALARAFGKVWLFRCQSGIRGLWLVTFGKLGLFRCQSTFATLVCQKNSVFLCKGTKLQKAVLFALFGEAEFWGRFAGFRFGRLCNLGLSKKQRFSLQRHKAAKSYAFCVILRSRILGTVCRFPLLLPLQPWFAKDTAFFSAKA